MTDQLTDAQLSERVCKALGIACFCSVCGRHTGGCCTVSANHRQPDPAYPNVLDWEGFGLVVNALWEARFRIYDVTQSSHEQNRFWVSLRKLRGGFPLPAVEADTLPRALALAVLSMEESR